MVMLMDATFHSETSESNLFMVQMNDGVVSFGALKLPLKMEVIFHLELL